MNAVTTIAPGARAQVLIMNARAEYGQRNRVSMGAVALAEWLAEHQDDDAGSALALFVGGWGSVQRMLADDVLPGMEWGEEMGRLTEGAVTASFWRRPYGGDLPQVVLVSPSYFEPKISGKSTSFVMLDENEQAPRPDPVSSGILCEVAGRPGEVEPGPLFAAVYDPLTPNAFVVTGFGHAQRFDAPMARAFRAALADGLNRIGAREQVNG